MPLNSKLVWQQEILHEEEFGGGVAQLVRTSS